MSDRAPVHRWPIIVADPAWKYKDQGTRLSPEYAGTQRPRRHYNGLSLEQICLLRPFGQQVADLAMPTSILFLWITSSFLAEGAHLDVCRFWGFKPKQVVPWIKTSSKDTPRIGGGHYTRVCSEYLVIAARGRGAASLRKDRGVPGVLWTPPGKHQKHSAKPDASYDLIERLYDGPYLELFARRRWNSQWTAWGNQVDELVGALPAP